jgi:hypothetical protein
MMNGNPLDINLKDPRLPPVNLMNLNSVNGNKLQHEIAAIDIS